jgi:L-ascorbate metabolism protein UlaG (beta-lactamase superfamily)
MNPIEPRWPRRRFLRVATLGASAALTGGAVTTMYAGSPHFPVSDHCDGRRFFNPRGNFEHSLLKLLRWKLGAKAAKWPAKVDVTPQVPSPAPRDSRIVATWINHATFLLQTRQQTLLIDPVWSERAGPGGFGPRRVHSPGVRFDDLPKIDTVLLSHDHYDHCDLTTLGRLAKRDAPTVIAPLGHRPLLKGAGFAAERIVELDWWEAHAPGGPTGSDRITITLTPARHWCNRVTGPANGRLWGGFFLRTPDNSAWFAGDTGYDDRMFREIREKLGAPQLALIPIGAYAPRWFMEPVHCNPEEAVRIHQDIGAQHSIGMHWGTFQLTDEGREDPVLALAAARAGAGLKEEAFKVLAPGGSITV